MSSENPFEDRNVFLGLSRYHPREGHDPRENFLTEAFAYVLMGGADFRTKVLTLLTGDALTPAVVTRIETQFTYANDEDDGLSGEEALGACRPDMVIEGVDDSGTPFTLVVENKWRSSPGKEQLEKYKATLERQPHDGMRWFFVLLTDQETGIDDMQSLLEGWNLPNGGTRAVFWRDVHKALEKLNGDDHLRQFCNFLEASGLTELPKVCPDQASGYTGARRSRSRGQSIRQAEFKNRLTGILNAALNVARQSLTDLPDFDIDRQWGRIGFRDRSGHRAFGLLYNVGDHETAFLDPEQPLDICVRIQAPFGQNDGLRQARRRDFEALRAALADIGYKPPGADWETNDHTVLLAQRPFPWSAGTGREQAEAVSKMFVETWRLLNQPPSAADIDALPKYKRS